MIRSEAKEYDLGGLNIIHLRPGDDFVFFVDFTKDMTGATHEVQVEQYQYPHTPDAFQQFEGLTVLNFDTSQEADGIIKASLNSTTVNSWEGYGRLDLRWITTLNGRTWVVADRSLIVQEGD